jgi:hypothetical protein
MNKFWTSASAPTRSTRRVYTYSWVSVAIKPISRLGVRTTILVKVENNG